MSFGRNRLSARGSCMGLRHTGTCYDCGCDKVGSQGGWLSNCSTHQQVPKTIHVMSCSSMSSGFPPRGVRISSLRSRSSLGIHIHHFFSSILKGTTSERPWVQQGARGGDYRPGAVHTFHRTWICWYCNHRWANHVCPQYTDMTLCMCNHCSWAVLSSRTLHYCVFLFIP